MPSMASWPKSNYQVRTISVAALLLIIAAILVTATLLVVATVLMAIVLLLIVAALLLVYRVPCLWLLHLQFALDNRTLGVVPI